MKSVTTEVSRMSAARFGSIVHHSYYRCHAHTVVPMQAGVVTMFVRACD